MVNRMPSIYHNNLAIATNRQNCYINITRQCAYAR